MDEQELDEPAGDPGYTTTTVKWLEGWLNFPDAAQLLGMSKQALHKIVFGRRGFNIDTDVRAVTRQPLYVIRVEAVREEMVRRGISEKEIQAAFVRLGHAE